MRRLVRQAQQVFSPVHAATMGDDGYVSFELDPLLEDADCPLSLAERTAHYIELGKQWSAGHANRMIKVPATPAGLAALEELAAAGVTLNVTLILTLDQRHFRLVRPNHIPAFEILPSLFIEKPTCRNKINSFILELFRRLLICAIRQLADG